MRWFINFILFFLLIISNPLEAKIKLSIDRNEIRANETFQLTLEVEDQSTLSNSQDLDFLPKEFQVLGSQHFQKSTVINRQFANRMGWTIKLISNQAGIFNIPSFTIGNESSTPFSVQIFPAINNLDELNPNSQIKLTSEISSNDVYVQQQIIYTLRIYSSVQSRRHNLTPLAVDNAIIKKLGEASDFQLFHKGELYNVKEEKYAIFPQKSGELNIAPIKFRTNIIDPQAAYGSLNRYRPIELSSKPFTAIVRPKPEGAESPWIPAIDLELTAKWQFNNNDFEVGKPATLDFYIKGVALLPEQLPVIEFPEVDGLKIYRDKPVIQNLINANGVNSYHLEKLAVIPNQAGEVTIPELKIPYWNTNKNEQDYAILQPITLQIGEAKNVASMPTVSQSSEVTPDASNVVLAQQNHLWKYLTFGFAALWLLTLYFYFSNRKHKQVIDIEDSKNQKLEQESALSLQKAARSSDAKIMAKAIIQWIDARSGNRVSNLNQLINHCPNDGLKKELIKLQSALYANHQSSADWNGDLIVQKLKELKFTQPETNSDNEIHPLYPH